MLHVVDVMDQQLLVFLVPLTTNLPTVLVLPVPQDITVLEATPHVWCAIPHVINVQPPQELAQVVLLTTNLQQLIQHVLYVHSVPSVQ